MLNKSLPSHPGEASGHILRVVSEAVAYPPATPAKTGPFSHFLRRIKPSVEDAAPPPPTPPKDTPIFAPQSSPPDVSHSRRDSSELAYYVYHSPKNSIDYKRSHDYAQGLSRPRQSSVASDIMHITHDDSDMVVIEPQRPPTALETKWAAEPFAILDPAERARRRSETKRHQEEEEKKAIEEEKERQRLLKLKKQAVMEQEREEEFLRRIQLDKDLRNATAERMRREKEIKEEEEMKAWATNEKKRMDKERKAEEARKLEAWRAGEQRRCQEMMKRKEDEIQRKERERKARLKIVEAKIWKGSSDEMMTGWVTVQTSDSLTLMWRRRFFKFIGSAMLLYRSPKVIYLRAIFCVVIDDILGHEPRSG